MADVTLRMLLVGKDVSASKSIKGVGDTAGRTGGKLGKLGAGAKIAGAAVAGALVAAGAAAIQFGGDSLKAYADADKSQKQLEDAYKRFPKLANVNIDSLREYNQTLQRKTGADADDLAASQAQLAAFKLSGKQIKSMSPLLIDYANKTGKSLPDAAKTLGKATLGNTRALKDLGISYKSTGDPAKDYANIMTLLKEKVGGYTDSIPEAEAKQKILQASFGDLQEAVGEKLQPAMIGLIDAGQGVMDWLEANPEVTKGASAAFDLFATALGGIWDVVRKFILPGLGYLAEAEAAVIRTTADMVDYLNTIPGIGDLIPDDAGDKLRDIAGAAETLGAGLKSLANDPPEVTVETEAAKKNVADVQTKIDGIKGKIVTAKAKGDDKELEKLKKKLAAAEKKKWQLSVRARAISGGGWKITGNVSGSGDRYTLKAFRQGGRPRPGQIAQFHKDEIWAPDVPGTVISQSRSRALMGTGPAALSMATGGGDVYVTNHVTVDARGAQNPARVGRETAKALAAGQRSLRGRTYQFKAQTA